MFSVALSFFFFLLKRLSKSLLTFASTILVTQRCEAVHLSGGRRQGNRDHAGHVTLGLRFLASLATAAAATTPTTAFEQGTIGGKKSSRHAQTFADATPKTPKSRRER